MVIVCMCTGLCRWIALLDNPSIAMAGFAVMAGICSCCSASSGLMALITAPEPHNE